MKALLERIGFLGLLAVALLGAVAAFHLLVQRPQEMELRALEDHIAQIRGSTTTRAQPNQAAQMVAFYTFFEKTETTVDWLAKLYGIGSAAGVELREADYRMQPTGTRIVRYQVTLPVSTTYAKARAFAENALNEIPVLSLDQANFRRKRGTDTQLDVEIVMTLHLLEP